jgi:hypothetical protein
MYCYFIHQLISLRNSSVRRLPVRSFVSNNQP